MVLQGVGAHNVSVLVAFYAVDVAVFCDFVAFWHFF